MMTWDETIAYIRSQPQYAQLVRDAYFDTDLLGNVERFAATPEYAETLRLLAQYAPKGKSLLDIGCGNGMSAINFARSGWDVSALEPDPSPTIGAEAIRTMKAHFGLDNLTVLQGFAENLDLPDASFDVVYIRQAMHHAHDLQQFIAQAARVLRSGGILLTVRDHVIFDEADKEWFLKKHPLHHFYGGENAFTQAQYTSAMENAGLQVEKTIRFFDSPINYTPAPESALIARSQPNQAEIRRRLAGFMMKIPYLRRFIGRSIVKNYGILLNEREVAGRLYTFVARKK
jgi:ubiquinone/menaquinone biosynthesis C-methylase UbiE